MEIGASAISFLVASWEGHLTPPEAASMADKASKSRDDTMVNDLHNFTFGGNWFLTSSSSYPSGVRFTNFKISILHTVDVRNWNTRISDALKMVRFSNSSDFRHCLKSK